MGDRTTDDAVRARGWGLEVNDPSRQACLAELADLVSEIRLDHPVRVAIDGVDAAGKMTLADELAVRLRLSGRSVIRASMDGFHHPRVFRYRRGGDSPEGYFHDSFDYAALRRALLDTLGPGGLLRYRTAVFDSRVDAEVLVALRKAGEEDVLLFDGVFLQRPEISDCWDFSLWVDVPFDVAVERAIRREIARDESGSAHAETFRARYLRRYVPGQRLYLTECRPRERADVVFDNTDFSRPHLEYRAAGGYR